MPHDYVERTSPKGTPFVGRCRLCGKEGLTLKAMQSEKCSAEGKHSNDEVLIAAVEGRDVEPK